MQCNKTQNRANFSWKPWPPAPRPLGILAKIWATPYLPWIFNTCASMFLSVIALFLCVIYRFLASKWVNFLRLLSFLSVIALFICVIHRFLASLLFLCVKMLILNMWSVLQNADCKNKKNWNDNVFGWINFV
jgi:hypothetical protein